jgi:hypothetical protein
VAPHRLRRRFRELLREHIAPTVGSSAEVGEEIRQLCAALAARSGWRHAEQHLGACNNPAALF